LKYYCINCWNTDCDIEKDGCFHCYNCGLILSPVEYYTEMKTFQTVKGFVVGKIIDCTDKYDFNCFCHILRIIKHPKINKDSIVKINEKATEIGLNYDYCKYWHIK